MTTAEKSKANDLAFCVLICSYFCVSLGLNNGFILGGLTAFDGGFLERLDITVAQLKLRDSMTFIIVGVFALATGALVDKLGALRVLMIGHVLFGLAFWLLSTAQSIETIYVSQAILGLCQLCSGYLVCVIALSRYLPYKVGLAIGLMLAATSLGNAILPALNFSLIENYGPTKALLVIAATALPLLIGALAISRAKPRGDMPAQSNTEAAPGPTLPDALRRVDFWALCVIAGASFFSFAGMATNVAIYADSAPFFDIRFAEKFFFTLFIAALITQVAAGWIADSGLVRPFHCFGLLCMSAATLGIALSATVGSASIYFGLLGFGWGFNYVFIQAAVPKRFAGKSLGKIFGAILVAEAIAGALGPYVFGLIYDSTKSYSGILYVSSGALFIAVLAAAILHAPHAQLQAKPQTV
ncbi:MAG: MFS transporter [Pseudomonadota bacterium]